MRWLLALALLATASCGVVETLRPRPTIAPLISAKFLTVRLFTTDAADAHETARLPVLRDALAAALPNAWSGATGGRGQLALRTDADIDVELNGNSGRSALTEHKRFGRIVSRTIRVHTMEGGRRLSVPELVSTTLHELGHIWCCYGPATNAGHWADPSASGLMASPLVCQRSRDGERTCPVIFSDRELAEMKLTSP